MKKIIIIGAGIAGLSAGIYARKKGFDVTIYESHFLPGGLCTGWKRKGYYFEGCFHYIRMMGLAKSSMFYDLWKDLGVLASVKMISQENIQVFRSSSGESLTVYTDPDRLKEDWIRISGEDRKMIRELCRMIKRAYWFTHKAGLNPFQWIRKIWNILTALPFLFRYGALNLQEYSAYFKHPLIRYAISDMFDNERISCIQLPMFLGLYDRDQVYFPRGGSLALAKTIEKTFLDLGGKIIYKAAVKKVITEYQRATGVVLEDATQVKADIILSAADGHQTMFELLDPSLMTQSLKDLYEKEPEYSSFIQVSLGVSRKMDGLPAVLKFKTGQPFQLAGEERDEICLTHYEFDPSLAPKDKNVLIILYKSGYSWWEKIAYHSSEYEQEKINILNTTLVQLEKILPGISQQIEMTDVSTPHTTVRYTHIWKAALGFIPTPAYLQKLRKPQYRLDGLDGFYMTGQWVSGMGVPNAALGGRKVIDLIAREDC